jgi:hypothetical protein
MTSRQEPDYRSFRNKGQGGAPLDDEDKKRQKELNEWRAKRKLPWWMTKSSAPKKGGTP